MKKLSSAFENRAGGKLFNFRPILFAATALALGITFAYFRLIKGVSFLWLFCALPVSGTALIFSRDKYKTLAVVCALALCFTAGALSFSRQTDLFRFGKVKYGECSVTGTVTEKREYGKISRVVLSDLSIDGEKTEGALVATLGGSLSEKAVLSARVVAVGKIVTDLSLFDEYGFRTEEIAQNVRFSMSVTSLAVADTSVRGIPDVFRAVRSRLKDTLYAGMNEDSAAVTYALLTGDTSGIESGLVENIRFGGIAHIFSVSGLHIGALYAFCRLLTKKTRLGRLPKILRFLFTASVVIFYGGVCGFSASVVRSVCMCLIVDACSLSGIKSDLLENIGAAAFLILLCSPVSLFEVGFQLSFVACLGIGVFYRSVKDGLSCLFLRGEELRIRAEAKQSIFDKIKKSAISFFSVTISAQIATTPILLSSFGYISVWSLLLNCVFVPIIGGVFAFLLALALVACALPLAVAPVLLFLPSALFSALTLAFYAFDFSFVLSGFVLGGATVFYYISLLLLSDKINLSVKEKLVTSAMAALLFVYTVYQVNA